MNFHKSWIVARREYWVNFRSPGFLFMAFVFPLMILGLMFFVTQFLIKRESNTDNFKKVGYVDYAGIIQRDVEAPKGYFVLDVPEVDSEAYIEQQLEDHKVDAVFVIAANYTLTGQVDLYSQKSIPEALKEDFDTFLSDNLVAQGSNLKVPSDRLVEPFDPVFRTLDSDKRQSEAALIGRFLLPTIFVFVFFIATSTTSQFMMGGVVEEKENRLMEILASSVRPIELLMGKLLGLSGLAFTQITFWLMTGAVIALTTEQGRDFFSGAEFQVGDIVLMIILFILDFILMAAIMLAIGAAVTAESESRQAAGFIGLVAVLPLAANALFFTNPNGPIPILMSFFPMTSPVAIIMRIGLTSVPAWQIAISMVFLVATTVGVVWLAAVVFRLGMLMYGKVLTPRLLWQALRENQSTPVVKVLPE
ncbi:MAG: ABC transporter permease [Chloroflexi bacterium]|nr:ABC transporter permease [Chloroflexota bacterium]